MESDGTSQSIFSMAPDGLEDYLYIHSAFLRAKDGEVLLKLYDEMRSGNLSEVVVVQLRKWPEEAVEGSAEEAVEGLAEEAVEGSAEEAVEGSAEEAEESEKKESPTEENAKGKNPMYL